MSAAGFSKRNEMNDSKKAIFITVRTNSTRLPRKALLEINGTSTIEHVIHRVKRSKKAEAIVLCTTEIEEDDVLCEIARTNGIFFHRGSVKDKLDRWRGAAIKYSIEFFVTADGDDLFCEPELIDLAFEQYEGSRPDFIEAANVVCGAFTYGIKTAALLRVCEIKDTDDTEMMWVYFKETGIFKVEDLRGVDELYRRPDIRMTLDYPEDFEFFRNVIENLSIVNPDFGLRDIIGYLDQNPEVIRINQHLHSQWAENQKKKTQLVLKN
jgi:spore coat polysaccharide biosynthesis protein SpsF